MCETISAFCSKLHWLIVLFQVKAKFLKNSSQVLDKTLLSNIAFIFFPLYLPLFTLLSHTCRSSNNLYTYCCHCLKSSCIFRPFNYSGLYSNVILPIKTSPTLQYIIVPHPNMFCFSRLHHYHIHYNPKKKVFIHLLPTPLP